jgi:hypothetical protein
MKGASRRRLTDTSHCLWVQRRHPHFAVCCIIIPVLLHAGYNVRWLADHKKMRVDCEGEPPIPDGSKNHLLTRSLRDEGVRP